MLLNNILGISLNILVSRRALNSDPRDRLIRDIAVWFGSLGGTSFRNADLTDADLTGATLKNANFTGANLTRTNFHLAKQLNLARLGRTILTDYAILNLLITHRGSGQTYTGKSLKGANLAEADLADAIFTEADLSQADLTGADLQRATLIKTQALGTQFRQANLTGACLEAWNIDSTTQLEGAVCEHVYLLRHQQERRPNSGSFQPGEFTKLFQEVLDTVDLIFQNGIDWKAFLQTFRDVQVQHEGADLAIQTIENKGDGVVVVKLNAAPDTDKSAVHESLMNGYQSALQAAEERYRAQLDAKDEQITDYRQQNANMQEVVKLLAARPINVDVKAFAQSRAMQGNDQSRNINIGGDFNATDANVMLNLGELSGQVTNQIQQLPDNTTGPTDQPSLKDLLTQLQTAIETDDLSDTEKADALEEVATLATAGQAPQQPDAQKTAKRSLNVLKGIASGVSDASKLAVACEKLLPLLLGVFGL
ncbi:MAG: pentapeptide repeat-containing protein [Cyanobacteria bacterium P01_A01_bin.135]